MVNNINGVTSSATGNTRTGASNNVAGENRTDNQQTNSSAPAVENDSFNISNEAKLLSSVQSSLSDLPDVDQERVESLRQQINSGQFQVDSSTLAQDIINLES